MIFSKATVCIQLITLFFIALSVTSSSLELSLIDKFGDGWGDAALMVVTPSEELGAMSPTCGTNPLNMNIDVNEDGLYYFIVSNTGDASAVQNPWEIFWTISLTDSSEVYSGGYNTTLVLDYNKDSKTPWSLVYWDNLLPKESSIKSCSKGQVSNTKTCSKSSIKKTASTYSNTNRMPSSMPSTPVSKTKEVNPTKSVKKSKEESTLFSLKNTSLDTVEISRSSDKSSIETSRKDFSITQIHGTVEGGDQFFSSTKKPTKKTTSAAQSHDGEIPSRGQHKGVNGATSTSASRGLLEGANADSSTSSTSKKRSTGILKAPETTSKGTTVGNRQNQFIRAVVSKTENDQTQRRKGPKSSKDSKKSGPKSNKEGKGNNHFGKHDSYVPGRRGAAGSTKKKDKTGLQLQVTMYDSSGSGWRRGYLGTSFYISDDKMESLVAFGSLESGSYSGICSYCLPEGSYFFRVASSADSDSTADAKWNFCGVDGLPSQQLSFHVEDGVCVPDATVDLDTICYGTISSYVTIVGAIGLYGLKAAVLERQETVLVENALKAVVSGWANAVFTTTSSTLDMSKAGLGLKLQFSVVFESESAFDVDGMCHSAVVDLVEDIGATLNQTISSGKFKSVVKNVGQSTLHTSNFDHVSNYVFEGLEVSGVSYSGAKSFNAEAGSDGSYTYSDTRSFADEFDEESLLKQPLAYHHVLIVFSLVCMSVAGFFSVSYGFSRRADRYAPALDKSEDGSVKSSDAIENSSGKSDSPVMDKSTDSTDSTSFVMSVSYLINETQLASAARVQYDESSDKGAADTVRV